MHHPFGAPATLQARASFSRPSPPCARGALASDSRDSVSCRLPLFAFLCSLAATDSPSSVPPSAQSQLPDAPRMLHPPPAHPPPPRATASFVASPRPPPPPDPSRPPAPTAAPAAGRRQRRRDMPAADGGGPAQHGRGARAPHANVHLRLRGVQPGSLQPCQGLPRGRVHLCRGRPAGEHKAALQQPQVSEPACPSGVGGGLCVGGGWVA